MTFQPILIRGGRVDPIPAPRRSVQNLMLATAMAAGGDVDQNPGRYDPTLSNCFLMQDTDMIVAGTGTRRPLLLREFADVCDASAREGVIVRLGDDLVAGRSTFDVKLRSSSSMLCSYTLWLSDGLHPTAWLVPSAGGGIHLRFSEIGFEIVRDAPYLDDHHRRTGLVRGANFLGIAGQGWF